MGWGGGTEIFDTVVEELKDLSYRWTGDEYHEDFMEPLKNLLVVLEEMDYDNACESSYYDHPVIGKILGNDFYEDLEEEG